MKQQYPVTLIFSVSQANDTDHNNAESHSGIISYLAEHNIGFKEVMGSYKGVMERSLVVDGKYEDEVLDICKANKQICYLRLDQDRNAEFVNPYKPTKTVKAGVFKAVEHLEANEDYTLDLTTGIKYAIR